MRIRTALVAEAFGPGVGSDLGERPLRFLPRRPSRAPARSSSEATRARCGRALRKALGRPRRSRALTRPSNHPPRPSPATLSRAAETASIIAEHLEGGGGWLIDPTADDIFYSIKGRMYGYYMILRGLGTDFAGIIDTVGLTTVWDEMLDSLESAVALDPVVIVSGQPDSQIMPSHLAAQGFFLLRARTQLKEISNVLLNRAGRSAEGMQAFGGPVSTVRCYAEGCYIACCPTSAMRR